MLVVHDKKDKDLCYLDSDIDGRYWYMFKCLISDMPKIKCLSVIPISKHQGLDTGT